MSMMRSICLNEMRKTEMTHVGFVFSVKSSSTEHLSGGDAEQNLCTTDQANRGAGGVYIGPNVQLENLPVKSKRETKTTKSQQDEEEERGTERKKKIETNSIYPIFNRNHPCL